MKIRIHREDKIVAAYLRKLKCWDFYRMTKKGRPVKNQQSICAFTPSFTKAITIAREDGWKLTHQDWEHTTIDSKKYETLDEIIRDSWRRKEA